MKKLFKKITVAVIPLLLLLFFSSETQAQQMYNTLNGEIELTMKYKDTVLRVSSHALMVRLNYENGQILFRVPYNTFYSGVNEVDSVLAMTTGRSLEFNGKLGIRIINTEKHPQQNFTVEGTITTAIPPVQVKGNGTITHENSNGGSPACMLMMKFSSDLSVLQLQDVFPGVEDPVQIIIMQSILKKTND